MVVELRWLFFIWVFILKILVKEHLLNCLFFLGIFLVFKKFLVDLLILCLVISKLFYQILLFWLLNLNLSFKITSHLNSFILLWVNKLSMRFPFSFLIVWFIRNNCIYGLKILLLDSRERKIITILPWNLICNSQLSLHNLFGGILRTFYHQFFTKPLGIWVFYDGMYIISRIINLSVISGSLYFTHHISIISECFWITLLFLLNSN